MSTSNEVTQQDLHDLLQFFQNNSFDAASCVEGSESHDILKKCESLFKHDYTLVELDNTKGFLCPRYPCRILIPECEHGHTSSTLAASNAMGGVFNPSVDNAPPQNIANIINDLQENNVPSLNIEESSTTPLSSSANSDGVQSSSATLASKIEATNIANQNQQQQSSQEQSAQHSNQPQSHYCQQHKLPAATPNAVSNTKAATTSTTATTSKAAAGTIYEDQYDFNKIRNILGMAKYARCRQRFVVPVIMYRGKYICRSATVSIYAETYARKVLDSAYDYILGTNYSEQGAVGGSNQAVDHENNDNTDDFVIDEHLDKEPKPFTYDEVVKSDIQLLNALNISTVVDLMVEQGKIKCYMTVSSSEKADPANHYTNFNLLSLPYPGCEFFKKFRDNNYKAKDLHYDWDQSFNNANISVPTLGAINALNIDWSDYKSWDLVLVTQNYLKLCLKYIQEEKSGLLIHCISGWDRTPLFICLVRLSLWADGLIHQSLNPLQMTYFTLAYDWFLFGHQLPDRVKKGEDVMLFCFHVLKFIIDEEFSIAEHHRRRTKTTSSSGSSSVIILKHDTSDDDPLKEKEDIDEDNNDSFANSSNCDISITDNFSATAIQTTPPHCSRNSIAPNSPNNITNRSPNTKRTNTSPISVPGASGARQRHESTSSTGSWQVVTETGSIDSTCNDSYLMRNASSVKPAILLRKQRLSAIRVIFIQAYGRTVGLKFKEKMNLAKLIGNVADILF